MSTRRLPHTPATPSLTGGDDRPEPACAGQPEAYDILIDFSAGPVFQSALREAVRLCKSCPLEVAAKCFTDNADEQWVKAIREAKHAPRSRPECGSNWGVRRHGDFGEYACEPCKVFLREKAQKRKARKAAEVAA